jgi:hypothetical protein
VRCDGIRVLALAEAQVVGTMRDDDYTKEAASLLVMGS